MMEIAIDSTISTKSEPYKNARKYYAESVAAINPILARAPGTKGHAEYDATVVKPFYQWLASQGAQVVQHRRDNTQYGLDSYNIAPASDVLEFEKETDLTMFMLRWA